MTIFSGSARIEGVHPLQFGFVRRKLRTQRRYGMPIVNPLVFYPWRALDFLKAAAQWLRLVAALSPHHGARRRGSAARSLYRRGVAAAYRRRETDHLVEVFADKIPNTHGAPVRAAAAAAAE